MTAENYDTAWKYKVTIIDEILLRASKSPPISPRRSREVYIDLLWWTTSFSSFIFNEKSISSWPISFEHSCLMILSKSAFGSYYYFWISLHEQFTAKSFDSMFGCWMLMYAQEEPWQWFCTSLGEVMCWLYICGSSYRTVEGWFASLH